MDNEKCLSLLIERESTIVEGGSYRCPEKELTAMVKIIKLKKGSIDVLNEQILNAIAEEEIDDDVENFVGHRIRNSDGLSQKILTLERRKSCCVNFSRGLCCFVDFSSKY